MNDKIKEAVTEWSRKTRIIEKEGPVSYTLQKEDPDGSGKYVSIVSSSDINVLYEVRNYLETFLEKAR